AEMMSRLREYRNFFAHEIFSLRRVGEDDAEGWTTAEVVRSSLKVSQHAVSSDRIRKTVLDMIVCDTFSREMAEWIETTSNGKTADLPSLPPLPEKHKGERISIEEFMSRQS
ncbi:hypothetical protein, partial [Methylobacterium sp. B1]|uniref:hypothetical protein n=1 Tax=Methylobacterium sp. B1 TaxID=91459 RepID=UPI001AEC642D